MKYYEYVDMYGYGIKKANFKNAWGDSYILVKTKTKFSLRKSIGLGAASQYVRFLTEEDAQNFIDNFLNKSLGYNNEQYQAYKVRTNRPCMLLDKKYNLYITTYQIPSNIDIAVLDKNNNLVKDESDRSKLTIDDLYRGICKTIKAGLMDSQIFLSKGNPLKELYFDYFFSELNQVSRIKIPRDMSLHIIFTPKNINIQNQDVIDLSGELKVSIDLFYYLDYSCYNNPDIDDSSSSYIYDELKHLRYVDAQDADIHISTSLTDFKSYISNPHLGYHSIDDSVRQYLDYKLTDILFDSKVTQRTKDLFDKLKNQVYNNINLIDKTISDYTSTDILESYIPDYILEDLSDLDSSCSYKVIEKAVKDCPQAYSVDIIFTDKKLEGIYFKFSYQKENAPFDPISLEFNICGDPIASYLSEEEKYIYITCTELFKKLGFKSVGGTLGKTDPYNKMCYSFILKNCKRLSSIEEFQELVDELIEVLNEVLSV